VCRKYEMEQANERLGWLRCRGQPILAAVAPRWVIMSARLARFA
jgi:hypothetical protein